MRIVLLILSLFVGGFSHQTMLAKFLMFKPQFDSARAEMWPDFERPSLIAGDIEQEAGWNQYAQLKTSYELGRGFSALTITYDHYGNEKMNVYEDIKRRNPKAFGHWKYRQDPFNAVYNLKSALFMHHLNWNIVSPHFDSFEQKAKATFTAYNCGAGRVISDARLCTRVGKNCRSWDNGVALHSSLKKTPMTREYSKSPFQINREYSGLVWQRAIKYQQFYK